MPTRLPIFAALLVALTATASCVAQRPAGPWSLPAGPDSFGVNIHFTDARPGEMKMIADGGFHWVRMDLAWAATEPAKGRYDFAAYDRLVAACEAQSIRLMFILDYTNPLYDQGLSPATDEGRRAFAAWAAAAATHFQGRGIVWEMYNEPNISFWTPRPSVDAYIALARTVGQALRAAAPGELYVGPAVSEMDYTFLEACFEDGLLQYWSAVTVHPYLRTQPENAAAHYRKLGLMIAKYAPKDKHIPILSGEWGYSAAWANVDENKQAKMLAREFLTNLAADVPVSIWYDWHNDGADAKDAESNFGTVRFPFLEGKDPPYEPKPAYRAARTLAQFLKADAAEAPKDAAKRLPPVATPTDSAAGADTRNRAGATGSLPATANRPFRFARRIAIAGDINDYVYLFTRGKEERLVAWTTADVPHEIILPLRPLVTVISTDMLGTQFVPLSINGSPLRFTLTDAPQYLAPAAPGPMLK